MRRKQGITNLGLSHKPRFSSHCRHSAPSFLCSDLGSLYLLVSSLFRSLMFIEIGHIPVHALLTMEKTGGTMQTLLSGNSYCSMYIQVNG